MERLKIEAPGKEDRALKDMYVTFGRRLEASPKGLCPVDMARNMIRVSLAQSCGKCTPCRVGLSQLTVLFEQVMDGMGDESTIAQIEKTARVIKDTADCAIGFEAANLALSTALNFKADFMSHIGKGRCSYGMEHAIPCTDVCPAHVDVPGYIALIKEGRYEDAVRLIRKDNPFPSVCGYVCEHPCENHCRRQMTDSAVNICGLKRFAVDNAGKMPLPKKSEATGKRIGVIGGGPGGLTAAYFLTLMGHEVEVFEQRPKLGGMLRYGIPDYRLPQDVLDKDIQYILDTGVVAHTDYSIGKDITLDELKEKFDAVYISIGAHDDKKLGIEGENAKNVISAVEMLRGVDTGKFDDVKNKRVVVIGGGNVAMDATRTALRLGAKHVTCAYRRRIEDMTALPEEVHEAQLEGAKMLMLHAPEKIETGDDGAVAALWCAPQMVSYIGADGRTSVRKANKDLVRIPCDYIIVAIGQAVHIKPFEESGISTKRGSIVANKGSFVEGSGNVFAGGDAVSGPATVIRAVAAGKVAADNIDNFLGYDHVIEADVDVPLPQLTSEPACGRVNLVGREIENIEGDFGLVSIGMSDEEAKQECSRCLRCDHFGYGIFRGGRSLQW